MIMQFSAEQPSQETNLPTVKNNYIAKLVRVKRYAHCLRNIFRIVVPKITEIRVRL
jgi:hypothetical protein